MSSDDEVPLEAELAEVAKSSERFHMMFSNPERGLEVMWDYPEDEFDHVEFVAAHFKHVKDNLGLSKKDLLKKMLVMVEFNEQLAEGDVDTDDVDPER